MSVIDALVKYAADAPKFNLNSIPLLGDIVAGYDGSDGNRVDNAYLDAWWKAYDEANAGKQDKLDRADVERLAGDMRDKWQGELEKSRNKHWWNIGDVSRKWLTQQAGIGRGDLEYMKEDMPDALKDLEWRIRDRALFNDTRGKALRQSERRLTGAAHITGQVLNGALLGLGADKYTKAVTGESIDDLASTYGDIYAKDYGEGAAARMENWLRLGGQVARIAGQTPYFFYGGGEIASLKGGVAGALKPNVTGLTRLGLNAANGGLRAVQGYLGASKVWYPVSAVSNILGYTASNAGMGGVGAGLNIVGDITEKIPASWAMQMGGTEFMAGYNVPLFSSAARYAQSLDTKIQGAGTLKRLGLETGRYFVSDFAGGPVSFAVRGLQRVLEDRPVNPFAMVGDAPANLAEHVESTVRGWSPYGAAAEDNAGAALLDEYRSSPEKTAARLSDLSAAAGGPPVRPEALGDDDYMIAYVYDTGSQVTGAAVKRAMGELFPDVDISNATMGYCMSMLSTAQKEQVADSVMPVLRNAALRGFSVPAAMWGLVSPEQRRELIKASVMRAAADQHGANAENGRKNHSWSRTQKLVGLAWDKGVKGDDAMFMDALQDEIGYLNISTGMASLAGEAMKNGGRMDDEGMHYWRLFTSGLDKKRTAEFADNLVGMIPLESLTAAMGTDAGSNIPSGMRKALGVSLAKRVNRDQDVLADFVPKFATAMKDGAGITGPTRDILTETVKHLDVSGMSKDKAVAVARALLSLQGEGVELDGELKEHADRLAADLEKSVKEYAWSDPLSGVPALVSLFAQKNGFGGLSQWLGSPLAFWTVAASLLFGLTWLGGALLGGDDDDEEDEDEGGGRKATDALSLMRLRRDRIAADVGGGI